MGRVPMPPKVVAAGLKLHSDCTGYKDDPLYIDFTANGYFAASAYGLFDPDLPLGKQTKDTHYGPLKPLQDNVQLILFFYDTDNGKLYADQLCVEDDCTGGCPPIP
jgi:hypothetical protein